MGIRGIRRISKYNFKKETIIVILAASVILVGGNLFEQSLEHSLPEIMYASDGGRQLLTIDTTTGKALTKVSMSPVPQGRGFVGLSFVPDDHPEKLFAGQGSGSSDIYTINTVTGLATRVGNAGLGSTAVNGIDFGPAPDCNLYAVLDKTPNFPVNDPSGNNHLVTINKGTGAALDIGNLGVKGMASIAFSFDGTLYGVENIVVSKKTITNLYKINPSTGAKDSNSKLQVKIGTTSGSSPSGGILSIEFGQNVDPRLDNILYAGTGKAVSPAKDGGLIGTINLDTGIFEKKGVATTGSPVEALAGFPGDNFPPKITFTGPNLIVLQRGNQFDETSDVTAEDCHDGFQEVSVNSNVDTTQTGFYQVEYTATDTTQKEGSAIKNVDVIEILLNPAYELDGSDTFTIIDPDPGLTVGSIKARIYTEDTPGVQDGFEITLSEFVLVAPSTYQSPAILFTTTGSTSELTRTLHIEEGSRIFVEYRGVISDSPGIAGSTLTGTGSLPSPGCKLCLDSDAFTTETSTSIRATTTSGLTGQQVNLKNDNTGINFNLPLTETPAGSGKYVIQSSVLLSNLLSTNSNPASPILNVVVGHKILATYGSETTEANIIETPLALALIGTQPDFGFKGRCDIDYGSTDTDKDGWCDIHEPGTAETGTIGQGGLTVTLPGKSTVYSFPCNRQLIAPNAPTDASNPIKCAQKNKRNCLVELDYMTNHKPDYNAILDVIKSFRDQGINCFFIVDEDIGCHTNSMKYFKPDTGPCKSVQEEKELRFGTLAERTTGDATQEKDRLTAKRLVAHWGLFIHQYTEAPTSLGFAEIGGNDFVCSPGAFTRQVGTRDQQAACIKHELGHNMLLRHGGIDDLNCKPNYISVMNWCIQTPQESGGFLTKSDEKWKLSYSTFKYNTIYENNLAETVAGGITGTSAPLRWTVVGVQSGVTPTPKIVQSGGAIDYDNDGILGEVGLSKSINSVPSMGATDGIISTLTSQNDYSTTVLKMSFTSFGSFANGLSTEPHIDGETYAAFNPAVLDAETSDPLVALPTLAFSIDEGDGTTPIPLARVVDYDSTDVDVVIDWGLNADVSPESLDNITVGGTDPDVDLTGTQAYRDNGTPTIGLTITNNRDGEVTTGFDITVNNVAPSIGTITVSPSTVIVLGEEATVSAEFTDPGKDDTHELSKINWGDGTESTFPSGGLSLTELDGSGTVSASHSYTTGGDYQVTVTVEDDDGGVATETVMITVVEPQLGEFISPIDNSQYNNKRTLPIKIPVTLGDNPFITAELRVYLCNYPPPEPPAPLVCTPATSKNPSDENLMVWNDAGEFYDYGLEFPPGTSGFKIIRVALVGTQQVEDVLITVS